MRRHWKLILGTIVAVLLVLGVAGHVWLSDLIDPMPEAAVALESDAVAATVDLLGAVDGS